MSIVAIMVDQREPEWVQRLAFGAKMHTVTLLEHGDVLATTDDGVLLAIERKTADDLLNSVRSGRLWLQLAGLRQQTRWAYLVVTGSLQPGPGGKAITDRGETGWLWSSVQGVLLRAQELGCMVVQASTDADFEPTVIALSERSHQDECPIEPVRTPRFFSEAEALLAALPGIGLDKAQALLGYANTAGWALNWLTDQESTDKVEGIGPKTRQNIRAALGLHDDESLCVIINGNPVGKGKQ